MRTYDVQQLVEKWNPILEHENAPALSTTAKKRDMAVILENSEQELRAAGNISGGQRLLGEDAPTNAMTGKTGSGAEVDTFDPVLISMVRRAMPNLIAYDICGVQPMTGPTGLIFAMRARYTSQTGDEAFYNEANTAYATIVTGANTLGQKQVGGLPGNTTTATANLAETGVYNFGSGMGLASAEALGSNSSLVFPEMAFSIEKVSVTAKTRALKAEYSMELAQDLKAIHGLDAETELANILSAEIMAEINREVVRTIYVTAKRGSLTTATNGVFDLDVDANGRWSVEKFKGMLFHIEREANQIAKETRRGKGNVIMCSSDVASALQMAGVLDYAPALNTSGLNVDDTGSTFAGVLNGRYRVYIDPYSVGGNFFVVGYKGSNAFDAGLFYCPYVPLQMVRAVDQNTFQPKIGFKTRYGMVANPFAEGANAGIGALTKDSNVYYRRSIVANLL